MQRSNLVIQIRDLSLVIVFGAGLLDLCLGLAQLRLTSGEVDHNGGWR